MQILYNETAFEVLKALRYTYLVIEPIENDKLNLTPFKSKPLAKRYLKPKI